MLDKEKKMNLTVEELVIIILVVFVSTMMVTFAILHFWYKSQCLKEKLKLVEDSDFVLNSKSKKIRRKK